MIGCNTGLWSHTLSLKSFALVEQHKWQQIGHVGLVGQHKGQVGWFGVDNADSLNGT